MNHLQLYIVSLINPKQLAATRVLAIGHVIQYAFLLILLLSIVSFIQFINGLNTYTFMSEGLEDYLRHIKWLIYPFAFLFILVLLSGLTFLQISIYALVGVGIARVLQRRGEYRQIWRTATYAMTWTTLLTISVEFTKLSGVLFTFIGMIVTILFLWIAIVNYPKQKM